MPSGLYFVQAETGLNENSKMNMLINTAHGVTATLKKPDSAKTDGCTFHLEVLNTRSEPVSLTEFHDGPPINLKMTVGGREEWLHPPLSDIGTGKTKLLAYLSINDQAVSIKKGEVYHCDIDILKFTPLKPGKYQFDFLVRASSAERNASGKMGGLQIEIPLKAEVVVTTP